MSALGPLVLSLGADPQGAERSLESLALAFETGDSVREMIAERFPDIFSRVVGHDGPEICVERGELLLAWGLDISARRARKLTLLLKPSQRYLELVAAVACHLKINVVTVHDWPVLSVDGSPASTVSEAAGESISGSGASPTPGGEA